MDNKALLEALAKAIEMEEKGREFYGKVSKKSKNDITKKTFNFLADNELLHKKNIRNGIDNFSHKLWLCFQPNA